MQQCNKESVRQSSNAWILFSNVAALVFLGARRSEVEIVMMRMMVCGDGLL